MILWFTQEIDDISLTSILKMLKLKRRLNALIVFVMKPCYYLIGKF